MDEPVEGVNTKKAAADEEKRLDYDPVPYPKSVFFIVSNEFCERFSFYGLRTILALYLKNQLGFSSDSATVIYHVFVMLCYFTPLLGAILADSWLGKFKTIFYVSIVYAIGNIVVSIAAVPNSLPATAFTMIGLVLIAIGTGGIKPCVSSFGGDQFVLPQQEVQLQKFFSIFYFSINAGSFISTFLTPVLREDVTCFGMDSCYPLAFGVPAILMITSLVLFLLGSRMYTIKKPTGNIVVQMCGCIWHALTSKSDVKRDNWLDKADDKYDKTFIKDVKAALRVLWLFSPLFIFWSLFEQQGSRWTFQATRMNGYGIKPDQMQVVNPILILVFIPLFEVGVYPLLTKMRLLRTPLQKIVTGGILAGVAFILSAVVETQLESSYPILPVSGEGQLRIYNGLNCPLTISKGGLFADDVTLLPAEHWENLEIEVTGSKDYDLKIKKPDCLSNAIDEKITLYEEEVTSYTILVNGTVFQSRKEDVDKSDNGEPRVMLIYSAASYTGNKKIEFYNEDGEVDTKFIVNATNPSTEFSKISSDTYTIKVDGVEAAKSVVLEEGGSYTWVIVDDSSNPLNGRGFNITNPNTMNMMWQIPQYVVLTAGEIMFSVTGMEFAFTQAPVSMKSVLTAGWLFSDAIGNVIVIIVTEAHIFDSQTYEFLLFAGLMLADMLIFGLMAKRYTYVEDLPRDEIEMKGNETDKDEHEE